MESARVESVRDSGAEPAHDLKACDNGSQQLATADLSFLRDGEGGGQYRDGGMNQRICMSVVEVERVDKGPVCQCGARTPCPIATDDGRLAGSTETGRNCYGGPTLIQSARSEPATQGVEDVPAGGAADTRWYVVQTESQRPFGQPPRRAHSDRTKGAGSLE